MLKELAKKMFKRKSAEKMKSQNKGVRRDENFAKKFAKKKLDNKSNKRVGGKY